MKISIRMIMFAVVASLFAGALATAQVKSAGNMPAPMQRPDSATVDMAPANASSNQAQSVAISANMGMDDAAMYDQYVMDEYMMGGEYSPLGMGRMPSGRNIFIIPSTQIKIQDHLAIERDIRVMSHIFDRVLKKPVNKLGGVFTVMDDFFGRDSRVTQIVYLDGYGIMFFVDVDFALIGPPKSPEAKEPNEPEEKADSTWEQAERELYAPPRATRRRRTDSHSGQEYDAGKVELLKKNLVETMKHASNIRALKPDESVILTVVGRRIGSDVVARRGDKLEWTFSSGQRVPGTSERESVPYPPFPPSVLTIRAQKKDVDAFSKGELDFAGFYERTQLLANWSGTAGMMVNSKYWHPSMPR